MGSLVLGLPELPSVFCCFFLLCKQDMILARARETPDKIALIYEPGLALVRARARARVRISGLKA